MPLPLVTFLPVAGMAGALGGATMAVATGVILQTTGNNYSIVFMIAGTAYLAALAVIHLLSPQLEPVEDVERVPGMFSAGTLVGFGFTGLVFGSFIGWCIGLVSRVAGQTLFSYMIMAGAIGIGVGVVIGLLLSRKEEQSAGHLATKRHKRYQKDCSGKRAVRKENGQEFRKALTSLIPFLFFAFCAFLRLLFVAKCRPLCAFALSVFREQTGRWRA